MLMLRIWSFGRATIPGTWS